MLKATYKKHLLHFKRPSGTSRGILKTKEAFYIIIKENDTIGIGECGLLRGLSMDDVPGYEEQLQWVCDHIDLGLLALYDACMEFPSIQLGLETAFRSLESTDPFCVFPSSFSENSASIPINGLIWMGDKAFMTEQIKTKINEGFKCIKMKIGAIDFSSEIELLRAIRKEFSSSDIELRVDANGAFTSEEALEKLKQLSELDLHSIEQPIRQGQWQEMAHLCQQTPLPIALDEELIGIIHLEQKQRLLETIRPQYIILKPSFIGGFNGSDQWIDVAARYNINWWVTSALESNVGLNAICQYTYTKNNTLPQGLGTGSLYTNNLPSPLTVERGEIYSDLAKSWDISLLDL